MFLYMCYLLCMDAVSYTHARNHLAELTDRVCQNRCPILVTRQGAPPVVMMSLEDYRSLEETAYLLRSPRNAARLADAVAEAESGRARRRKLIDPK